MARKTLPLIDLRTSAEREGITKQQQTLESISRILQTVGTIEQKRQERQQLDNITRAINAGATSSEAILAASQQQPQFGTGLQGFFQKMGSRLQPSPGGVTPQIQGSIVSDALQRSLRPKQEIPEGLEVSGATRRPGGEVTTTFARPGQVKGTAKTKTSELLKVIQQKIDSGELEVGSDEHLRLLGVSGDDSRPFEQTEASKALDKDVKVLTDTDTKGKLKANETQKKAARNRLRQNPNLRDVTPGTGEYSENLKGKPKEKVGFFDKAFGKEAYGIALQEIKDEALARGITEISAEADFNAWWDEKAAQGAEGQPGFGKFVVPRSEFQEVKKQELDVKNLKDEELDAIIKGG